MTELAVRNRTGNLPAEVTRFIGRRRELAEVRQALEGSRLVTLCGVGGVGKTRLALRVAQEAQRAFPDGTWLVELSALREPKLLARTVGDALGLPEQSTQDPVDRLAEQLAGRRLLLVLDTCEHLVDSCALLAEVLLRAAPGLRILATSREPFDLVGEHVVIVAPVTDAEAVELFADRAEKMAPGFRLTDDNGPMVAAVCRRLEGIPLALELAAVRLRGMSLDQLATRLDDRFRLLGTARAGVGRHQTLRAAVEWSHDLCTGEERLLWARLSVFPGTFDLTAVEQVCGDETLRADMLVDVLGRLVEKSVVLCVRDGTRYRMLDTLREYGAERLSVLGERDTLAVRHRDHYLALAEEAKRESLSPRQVDWLVRLREDNANLRLALSHTLGKPGDALLARRMTIALLPYWFATGAFTEGLAWHLRVVGLPLQRDLDQGLVLFGAGLLYGFLGELGASRDMTEAAARIAAERADTDLAGRALIVRAGIKGQAGDLDGSLDGFAAARRCFAEAGYGDSIALLEYALEAITHCFARRTESALALCAEGLRASEEHGEQWVRSWLLVVRGQARRLDGDPAAGLADVLAGIRIQERIGDRFGLTLALDVATGCLVDLGELERAAVLLGGRRARWRPHHAPGGARAVQRDVFKPVQDKLVKALPEQTLRQAMRRGADMSFAEAAAVARGEPEAARDTPSAAQPLTRRELEVAALIAEGLSNREIAERLVIAKRTVDSHIAHILAKLDFASRAQIAAWVTARKE